MPVEDHRFHSISDQYISTGESGRAGSDNGRRFSSRHNFGEVGAPAHFQGSVDNILLNTADGDSPKIRIERTGPFTEPVLGTDPATDFRQAVGLVTELGRLNDASLIGKLQPVRNIIMDRTLPLTVGITAIKAAICLHLHLRFLERVVNFHKLVSSSLNPLFSRIHPIHFNKLEEILVHSFLLNELLPVFLRVHFHDDPAGSQHPKSLA